MTTTQTGSKTNRMIVGAINCVLMVLASTPSIADVFALKSADSKNQFTKLVGHITQLEVEKSPLYGNAFVIGAEGCFILTNFHVAFGKGRDAQTNEVEMVENVDVGHTVNFSIDLDSKSGKFKRKMNAKVVEFGNFENGTSRGLIGDIAILRLENCLGKVYSTLEFDRPAEGKVIPTGKLMTVSAIKNVKSNRIEMLVEEGCRSLSDTPAVGMMLSNCELLGGMSGSMLLEEGQDGKWRLVGLNANQITMKDGSKMARSIFANEINKFVDPVLAGCVQPNFLFTPSMASYPTKLETLVDGHSAAVMSCDQLRR